MNVLFITALNNICFLQEYMLFTFYDAVWWDCIHNNWQSVIYANYYQSLAVNNMIYGLGIANFIL